MLLFEYSRGECLDRIILQHRHRALRDDWTTIKRLVNEVDRASTHLHAMLERLSLRIESRKRRQQTRMNVEYPPPERLDETRRQEPHVSRQTNEIDLMLAQNRQ